MSDLVRNPEDRFSQNEAQIKGIIIDLFDTFANSPKAHIMTDTNQMYSHRRCLEVILELGRREIVLSM